MTLSLVLEVQVIYTDNFPTFLVDQHDFSLRYGESGDNTEAVVTYRAWSNVEKKIVRLVGRGLAVRHPDDQPNRGIGMNIALTRALEDLSAQIRNRVQKNAGFEFD